MFIFVDGSSPTQSRFDLMVASTKVLNAETAISEIWEGLHQEGIRVSAINGKPICLFRLHLFSRH